MAFLFDHFVGGYGKIARDCQSEHRCGLGVDHQIEFCRLLNWKIRLGFAPFRILST